MTEKKEEEEKDPNTDPNYRWLQVTPIFCDDYAVRAFSRDGIVRMVFGEATGRNYSSFWRASIVMPLRDAKKLVESLTGTIEEAEKAIAARKAKETSSEAS